MSHHMAEIYICIEEKTKSTERYEIYIIITQTIANYYYFYYFYHYSYYFFYSQ